MVLVAPSIQRDRLRLRDEFMALPGLTLTPTQVARLLSIREPLALKLLNQLTEERFLERSSADIYCRRGRVAFEIASSDART